jgi:hypothetical protein
LVNGLEVISKAVQQRPKTKAQIQSEIDFLHNEITKNGDKINSEDLTKNMLKLQALHQDASQ